MRISKWTYVVIGALGAAALIRGAVAYARQSDPTAGMPLPTGRFLVDPTPQTGVGSFPANLAMSPDGKWLAVTTTGAREYLSILSTEDGRLVSQLPFNRTPGMKSTPALYVGLAFAPAVATINAGQLLYVSRGVEDRISIFTVGVDGKLTDTGRELDDPSGLPKEARSAQPNYIAHIALNATGSRLYAVHNETSAWTDFKGSVSILDTETNRVVGTVVTPGFPYAVVAITRGALTNKRLYVTSERDGVVSVIDVADSEHPRLRTDLKVGDHPMALALDADQKRLFVANAGSDGISVIDTERERVIGTLSLRPGRVKDLPGMTPTGLVIAPDGARLYVTLGDSNAVAVVDIRSAPRLRGFIPAGWYPTAVRLSADGGRLFVANAKGTQPRNPNKAKAGPDGAWGQYIESILEGSVGMTPVPTDPALEAMTAKFMARSRTWSDEQRTGIALARVGIQHVIYIIKENRTYDQVLGDLPEGNGDPGLTLFGRDVTPNLHALALRFGLLDNFYDCAEVSADGWNWSTSGMVSEYGARNVHTNYAGRGRSYDFEGSNNDSPVDLLDIPDVNEAPGGYLWDLCRRHDVSYRVYGVFNAFADLKSRDGTLLVKKNAPQRKALIGHTDEDYLQFDMNYADSDAWVKYQCPAPRMERAFGSHNASSRFAEWKREFDAFMEKGDMPRLEMVRLPVDHTAGTYPGARSPRAMVADNDYAVGQIVDAVSHSKVWNSTAIFILEDDAQDGNDHVDAHRSICFVISPHRRRSVVDHHFYNTDSVLRSMETFLGLPPMNQYDAAAPLFANFETAAANAEPYTAILPARDVVAEVNQATAYRANDSRRLNFSQADQAPEGVLNDILWHAIKGAGTPRPAARHTLTAVRPDRDND